MLAADKGHKDIVLILAQKGANLDLVNKVSVHVHMLNNKPCITEHYFISVISLIWQLMVSLLLQQAGCGVLHYASYGGYTDIVKILLNYNADINIITKVI